jgi:predicted Fe-S protein YdhL (DUF1289 family)
MMLSSHLKTWKAISWCCLLTWRHEKPSHDSVFLLEDMKEDSIMRWLFMSLSEKTESWDGFSCLQVRRQNHEMAFHVFKWEDRIMRWLFMSYHLMILSSHLKPSHGAVFLLEDMKSHLLILSYYLKTWNAISWFCLLTWRHEKPSHRIMRWLFMSSSNKTESWDGFSCLQVRRQHHEMAFHVFKWEDRIMRWFLSKKAISWFCLLT